MATILLLIFTLVIAFILHLFAPYIHAYLLARKIRNAKGERLPFVRTFPRFPFGDAITQSSKDRLAALRRDPSLIPSGMYGAYLFAETQVVLTDPDLIQKVRCCDLKIDFFFSLMEFIQGVF